MGKKKKKNQQPPTTFLGRVFDGSPRSYLVLACATAIACWLYYDQQEATLCSSYRARGYDEGQRRATQKEREKCSYQKQNACSTDHVTRAQVCDSLAY